MLNIINSKAICSNLQKTTISNSNHSNSNHIVSAFTNTILFLRNLGQSELTKLKSKFILLFLALFYVFSLTLLNPKLSYPQHLIDRIAAIVNNDVITLVELNSALAPYMEKVNSSNYSSDKKKEIVYQLTQDMLNRMIERKLADQEAYRNKLTVSDKEIDSAIQRIKESQLMNQEDLEQALKKDGITFSEYREKIKQEILRPKLINYTVKSKVVITENDIKNYYEEHSKEFAGKKQYYLRNILLKLSDMENAAANSNQNNNMQREDSSPQREKAEKTKQELDNGVAFKEIAKKVSEASNAKEGGDLGFFEWDSLSDSIKKAIEPLKAGEHTDVILTDQGYQIFYVEEIQNKNLIPLSEVSETISQKLYDEIVTIKFREWLDSLKEKSHIKIML